MKKGRMSNWQKGCLARYNVNFLAINHIFGAMF
jgi:hypothetical protein